MYMCTERPEPRHPATTSGRSLIQETQHVPQDCERIRQSLQTTRQQNAPQERGQSAQGGHPPLAMPCYHPLPSWRDSKNKITLINQGVPAQLHLPCGKCIGCVRANAQAWSLRCQLELQQHDVAAFTTLTYAGTANDYTLNKDHLQLFWKRLRAATARRAPTPTFLRYFASGEYGEKGGRPHYHAIIYGLSAKDDALVQDKWHYGHTQTHNATETTIAYVAGYTAKKITDRRKTHTDYNNDTGEAWQAPFTIMSRRPGIGYHAKKFHESWRLYAILNGYRIPVPRYLHEAWKNNATPGQIQELKELKEQIATTRDTREETLLSQEKHYLALQSIAGDNRRLR